MMLRRGTTKKEPEEKEKREKRSDQNQTEKRMYQWRQVEMSQKKEKTG